ncbi:hypothetical protein J2X32_003075 [Rheinheimera pacifica]|uniref:hypothetical protein n=1 Tax=Rheinheimera pacifica TaxID=173990 RepID=UPI0028600F6A|nr:hypothetical protein [Rheinheimera pacifica]MDR6984431.1 hypothetical protein [Rheinheimera pacifica]
MAIMWKNWKHWSKGPAHFIAAFLIVITTYWYWHRIPTCWVGYDIFCHTVETSTFVLKFAAAASQMLGIFLLIYSLDSKMNLLRGDGLKEYVAKKWSVWTSSFKRLTYSSSISSTMPMLQTKVTGYSWPNTEAMTTEEKLEFLERRLKQHTEQILSHGEKFQSLTEKSKDDLAKIEGEIEKLNSEMRKLVDDLSIGGLSPQVWSFFLITYSAVLSVII